MEHFEPLNASGTNVMVELWPSEISTLGLNSNAALYRNFHRIPSATAWPWPSSSSGQNLNTRPGQCRRRIGTFPGWPLSRDSAAGAGSIETASIDTTGMEPFGGAAEGFQGLVERDTLILADFERD